MRRSLACLAVAGALAFSGCGHLDLAPEGSPGRFVTGQVALSDRAALPPGSVVTVRVVDASVNGAPPDVLGTQTLNNPGSTPVDFRVVYRAEDDVLRRGLNIEARVSVDGKMRYFNMNHYALNLGNAAEPHQITVNPISP
ncbi:MAG TPA: YbaY family lipoprotein [Opitutaceae bacterium]